MAAHLFAAIDVGSFELEMGIYETTSRNGLREIDHLRHVISLGRDTYHTGKISYHLVDEMCQVLEEFAQVMKSYQVEDYRLTPPAPCVRRRTARSSWSRSGSAPVSRYR